MRLLLWYVAAVYLFGPLLAAPLTGGDSLFCYVLPFFIFDFTDEHIFVLGCWAWLGWFVVSLFVWTIHLFIRMTIYYNVRKLSGRALIKQAYR